MPSSLKALFLAVCSLLFIDQSNAQTPASFVKTLKIGIVGDSTVSTYADADPHRGWGQLLPEFFRPEVDILNQATNGASTKSFPADRWRKTLEFKPDFVLIQFGHNDQHGKTKPEATDAATDYKTNLRRYVTECRQAGATPVLVTSMHRRTFRGASLTTELQPYVDAMKEVGQETKTPVVDLYAESGKLFESLGEEGSAALTVNNTDNADRPGKGDRTHFTAEGARAMAGLVAKGLAEVDPRLKASLVSARP